MIARILYRKNVHGVINYVFSKSKIRVLGFQNTYSETDTTKEQFTRILHYLGSRHESQKKYVHISINLPHGEKLSDINFYKLAKDYMRNMGYNEQPFVVVRHFDTKHQHIHIVSSTVQENGNLIDLSHDFRRNVATQKYLERKFKLTPSPQTQTNKELPIYRLPEINPNDSNGVKFYIQDILNSTLQKYKVRSFEQLSELVAPYHIVVKRIERKDERIGVAYGIDIENGYKSRFIDGYTVHPRLSGPKLQAVFKKQSQSKVLPMHKKRLEKQMITTYSLFKSINPKDLPNILKAYQNIDIRISHDTSGDPNGYTILDKSGYIFNIKEINSSFYAKLRANDPKFKTSINLESKQLKLEVRKLIKNAFYDSYLNGYKNDLLSKLVRTKKISELLPSIQNSDRYNFFKIHLNQNKDNFKFIIKSEFEQTKIDIYANEFRREKEVLEQKAIFIKRVITKNIFNLKSEKAITFDLLQSLGLKYVRGKISYLNSNRHQLPLHLTNFVLPETSQSYISTGFINQNEKVLNALIEDRPFKEAGLSGTTIFLPIIFPRLYKAMSDEHRLKFEKLSLMAYQKSAEKLHIPYEKSAMDYIRLFNEKGFYFIKKDGDIQIHSMYFKFPEGVPLGQKTKTYLISFKGLDTLFGKQRLVLDKIKDKNQDHLKNLWVSYLIEKQHYQKAAFMITYDGVQPNLPTEILDFHLNNGLRGKIQIAAKQKIDAKNARVLRKSIYAFSYLLGRSAYQEEEAFNRFRDELTDYGKYRNVFF